MKQSKDTLKSYFETGDAPTAEQFEDLIDSFEHKDEYTDPVRFYLDSNQISASGSNWGRGNTDHLVDEDPISAYEATTGSEILINNIPPVIISQYAMRRDSESVATHTTINVTYVFTDQRVLSSWVLQGSLDGTNWDDLDTVTNFNFTLDTNHVFTFQNETAYTHYRLLCNGTLEGVGIFVLSELELWEKGNLRKNLGNSIKKSETKFPSDLKFYNQSGVATFTPQTDVKAVYVDAVNGDNNTAKLQDRVLPYETVTDALQALPNATGNADTWVVHILDNTVHTINVITPHRLIFKKDTSAQFIIENNGVDTVVPNTPSFNRIRTILFDMPLTEILLKRDTPGIVLGSSWYTAIHFNIRSLKSEMVSNDYCISLANSAGVSGYIGSCTFSHRGISVTNFNIQTNPNDPSMGNLETDGSLLVGNVTLANTNGDGLGFNVNSRLVFRKNVITVNNAQSAHIDNILFRGGDFYRNVVYNVGNISNLTLGGGSNVTINCQNSVFDNWKLITSTGLLNAAKNFLLTGTILTWIIDGSDSDITGGASLITQPGTYPGARFIWNVTVLDFFHRNPPADTSNLFLFNCYQGLASKDDGSGDVFLDAQFINCPIGIFGTCSNQGPGNTLDEQLEATKLILKGRTILDGHGPIIVPYLNGKKRIEVQGELTIGNNMTFDTANIDIKQTFTVVGNNDIS